MRRRGRDGNDYERALLELRDLAGQLGGAVDVADLRRAGKSGLYERLLRLFGSIEKARQRAGIPTRRGPYKWTLDRILFELRLAHRSGIRLTGPALRRAGREDLLAAVENHFGGLPHARAVAGIAPPPFVREGPEPWSASRVVHVILDRHRSGKSLASSRVPARLRTAARVYWGSWKEAIEAAGLDYASTRLVHIRYGADELLGELLRLSREYPDMTVTQLQRTGIHQRLRAQFGGLANALRCAGIEGWPRRVREATLSRDETLAALRRLRDSGMGLRRSVLRRSEPHLVRSVARNFDSWKQALAALAVGPLMNTGK